MCHCIWQSPKAESAAARKSCFNLIHSHLHKICISSFFFSEVNRCLILSVSHCLKFSIYKCIICVCTHKHTFALKKTTRHIIIWQVSSVHRRLFQKVVFLKLPFAAPIGRHSHYANPAFAIIILSILEISGPFSNFLLTLIYFFPKPFQFLF